MLCDYDSGLGQVAWNNQHQKVVYIEPAPLQRIVATIIAEIDFIERRRESLLNYNRYSKADEFQVNGAKLRIIASLLNLRDVSGVSFEMPKSITEEHFWSEKDAAEQPTEYESPDPWMRFRRYVDSDKKGPIILRRRREGA